MSLANTGPGPGRPGCGSGGARSGGPTWAEIGSALGVDAAGRARAESLAGEIRRRGHLELRPREAQAIPTPVWAQVFGLLEAETDLAATMGAWTGGSQGTEQDGGEARARAVRDGHFVFLNIRACGSGNAGSESGEGPPGTIMDAVRLLPSLRENLIHLAPFTDYDHHVIYAITSIRSVSHRILDPDLAAAGLDGLAQIRALVRAAALLGKRVGFDLELHVAQFAMPVLEQPELFRWYKADPRSGALDWGLSEEAMLEEVHQGQIHRIVRDLVAPFLGGCEGGSFEYDSREEAMVRLPLFHRAIGAVMAAGCSTLPVQIWENHGVPGYGGIGRGYMDFVYRNPRGEDNGHMSQSIITPWKFQTGLVPHCGPEPGQQPGICGPALDAYLGIFPWWRDRAGFSFVRHDQVDHIFDSSLPPPGSGTWEELSRTLRTGDGALAMAVEGAVPLSDRPAPGVLLRACRAARKGGHGRVLNLAERMGAERELYGAAGFDALLGYDIFHPVGPAMVRSVEELGCGWTGRGPGDPVLPAVCLAVDTHDSGDPGFCGVPLVRSCSAEELAKRMVVARLGTCGPGRRPSYGVMGLGDRSWGLYRANVTEDNVVWEDDLAMNRLYHQVADIGDMLGPVLREAWSLPTLNGEGWAVFRHEAPDHLVLVGIQFGNWWEGRGGRCMAWHDLAAGAGPGWQPGNPGLRMQSWCLAPGTGVGEEVVMGQERLWWDGGAGIEVVLCRMTAGN